jgi:hypothetical protein
MEEEKPIAVALTAEDEANITTLRAEDIEAIDQSLFSNVSMGWHKVAMVVGMAMAEQHRPGIPDEFYAQRVRRLAELGRIESQGNLTYMRFSEVRLSTPAVEG